MFVMYNGKALERDKQVGREFWDEGDGGHRHNCFSLVCVILMVCSSLLLVIRYFDQNLKAAIFHP